MSRMKGRGEGCLVANEAARVRRNLSADWQRAWGESPGLEGKKWGMRKGLSPWDLAPKQVRQSPALAAEVRVKSP